LQPIRKSGTTAGLTTITEIKKNGETEIKIIIPLQIITIIKAS
jgi:hypothetical protein